MKKLLAAAALAACLSTPAKAVIVLATDIGASGTTTIQGLVNGVAVPGLTGTLFLEYTGLTFGGTTWNFDYTVANTSSLGITSRISSFALNTTPNVTSVASSGVYGFPHSPVNGYPGFVPTAEFCAGSSAGTCTGGGGVATGDAPASGTLALTFAGDPLSSISLDLAFMRFQDITGTTLGTSGAGINTPVITPFIVDPVPVPGAVWLFGTVAGAAFGAFKLRNRKKKAAAKLAA